MKKLFEDTRLYKIMLASMLSSIGSGITMVAIPWLLIQSKNGDQIYGYITLTMTLLLFSLTPYIGMVVDRWSRKSILLIINVVGLLLVSLFAVYGLIGLEYKVWMYISLFSIGSLYYSFFFPTMFAFGQEIFSKNQYQSLNGILEVQSQVAAMFSGAISSYLITRVDLSWILLINAITFGLALLLLMLVPYIKTFQPSLNESFWHRLTEGFRYIKKYPSLFAFFVVSFLPFIGVMVTNYLFPIYIIKALQAEASVFGLYNMIYAIGAVIAGLFVPILLKKVNGFQAVMITYVVYIIGIGLIFIFPIVTIFLLMQLLLGFGNAGTRVSRNTLMMELIPNDKMGRVNGLFQVIGLGLRILLIGSFSYTIQSTGVSFSLGALSLVVIIAFVMMCISIYHLSKVKEEEFKENTMVQLR